MNLYRRYLLRETAVAIVLVLLAFLGLFGFFDLIGELKDVGQKGYELHHALAYVLLRLPGRIYELMPVAVLIGTLYALSTLARHSEITVLRTSGLSPQQLLKTLFQVASIFAAITFLFGEFVAPPAERAAAQLRLKALSSVLAQDFRSGLWVKDERSFINVREVSADNRLRGVRIYEFDDKAQLRSVSEAAEGEYVPPASWRLSQVVQTVLHGEHAEIERKSEMLWHSALNPDILSVLLVVPERMSLLNLVSYINHLSENHQKTQRYETALWKKLTYPFATLVMVALALPFAYTQNRMSSVSLKIFSGVMLGILFYMLNGLFSSLGIINNWPPLPSAIAPSVLFLLAAIAMLWWVERR
ncbi:MAG: LPS export ABC transporter permease LptG [Pseudomonadota bacterium]